MADAHGVDFDRVTERAVAALHRARARLAVPMAPGEATAARWTPVEEAADALAAAANRPWCPAAVNALLLDWRDRLGSHVLAARALADLDVHSDLAEQFLRRGLDEVISEVPRLAEVWTTVLRSPTRVP